MREYLALAEFISFFQDVFGKVDTTNRYAKQNFLLPLFLLWTTSVDKLGGVSKRNAFFLKEMPRMLGNTRIIECCSISSSRGAKMLVLSTLKGILNKNKKKPLF